MAFHPSRINAVAVAAWIAIVVAGATSLQIWADYSETRERQETTVTDVTRVVAAHISNSLHEGQAVLGLIADSIAESGGFDQSSQAARRWRLKSYCESFNGCRTIAVFDAAGRIVAMSDAAAAGLHDLGKQTQFRMKQDGSELFVGPAIRVGGPEGSVLFTLSLPVFDQDGRRLGMITAGIATEHLTEFYGLFGFSVEPTIAVYKLNGDLVARYPNMQQHVGRNNASGPLFAQLAKAPSGVYHSTSPLDGKERMAAYKMVPEGDIVVYAGVLFEKAFNHWMLRSVRAGFISLFVLVVIGALLAWAYRAFQAQRDLRRKNWELDRLSSLDGLTRIPNRRSFDLALQQEWMRHQKEGLPLALMLLDVDDFKSYNDTYGHQAGDACLLRVAQTLKEALHRHVDRVARYGGEEFAVILSSGAEGALTVAQRLCEAVEALGIEHSGASASRCVTISIGVASTDSGHAHNSDRLLALADMALYQAKAQGRNQACLMRGAATEAEAPQGTARHAA